MRKLLLPILIISSYIVPAQTFTPKEIIVSSYYRNTTDDIKNYFDNEDGLEFLYTETQKLFYIDFKYDFDKEQYYKISFYKLKYEGKSTPKIFIRFLLQNKIVQQYVYDFRAPFYVFLTPSEFDNVRIVIRNENSSVSFNSFHLHKYDNILNTIDDPDLNTIVPIKDLQILLDEDILQSDYTIDKFIYSLKNDSIFYCQWNLGHIFDEKIWTTNILGRTQQRWLYGCFWLNDIVKYYEQTREKEILELSKDIIQYFLCCQKKCFSQFKLNSKELIFGNTSGNNVPMLWHDETVARRLYHFLIFSQYLDLLEDTSFATQLNEEIENMAKELSNYSFFARTNNHGMFQSFALLCYSSVLKSAQNTIYQDLSISRLYEYFLSAFTMEGVNIEHTPTYHFEITKRLGCLIDFLSNNFNKYDLTNLQEIHSKAQMFSGAILLPNGQFPAIGDCLSGFSDFEVLYKNINIYQKSGYAIIKDTKSYLLFLAAYNSWGHKHCDDLSFILWKDGNWIINDCGFFGYEKDDMMHYGNNSFAHNVLIVDDKNLSEKANQDKKYNSVGFLDYTNNNKSVNIIGKNKRFNDVEHYRRIIKSKNHFIIQDSIISLDEISHNYKLLLHLGEDIFPINEGKYITLKKQDKILGKIITPKDCNIIVYNGDNMNNSTYLGYHCITSTNFVRKEHYVICFEFKERTNVNSVFEIILK